jgi:hypothetical protein
VGVGIKMVMGKKKLDFDFISKKTWFDSLQVTDELQIKEVKAGPLTYFVIEDFLKDPYWALDSLSRWIALSPAEGHHSTVPGHRQQFAHQEYKPIVTAYKNILTHLGFQRIDITKFSNCSNICNNSMVSWGENYYPHYDVNQITVILWLSEHKGGTSFYSYNGKIDSRKLSADEFNTAMRNPEDNDKIVPWVNFEGDSNWDLYHVIPEKFNSICIYNGYNFHAPYPIFNGDEYRYNIISFYYDGWEQYSSKWNEYSGETKL